MFDDLHDTDPPNPGLDTLAKVSGRAQVLRRRRAMMLSGSGVAVIALIVAAVVFPRLGDDERRIITIDTSPTTMSPTDPVPSTTDLIIDSTTSSTVAGSTSGPSVSTEGQCSFDVRPPVYLIDGSLPGEPVSQRNDGSIESFATWGDTERTRLTQAVRTVDEDNDPFDLVSGSSQLIEIDDFTAAVLPVGDPPLGSIGITISDRLDGCDRSYFVGPGLETAEVVAFTRQWVAMLALDRAITTSAAPDDLGCTYVGGTLAGCVDVRRNEGGPLIDGRVDNVSGVGVLQLAVTAGSEPAPLSALARRVDLDGVPGVQLIVDLVPLGQSCGTVTLGSTSTDWAIGGNGESSCDREPPATTATFPIVAIDGNGDAVMVKSADGTMAVLAEGGDPDDPLPPEGTPTFIDGVTLTADGTTAVVGFCCEPGAGALTRVSLATGELTFIGYGHLPAMSSGGNLVSAAIGSVNVGALDGTIATTLFDDPDSWILDMAVVPNDGGGTVIAIVVDANGTRLWAGGAAGGDMSLEVMLSASTENSEPNFSLAGYAGVSGDAVYLVLDESTNTLMRFDAETLEPVGTAPSPIGAVSMWVINDSVRYVDAQRRLFANDVQVPGEYLWVR